eukprot:3941284-Rhodomonas_salina.5
MGDASACASAAHRVLSVCEVENTEHSHGFELSGHGVDNTQSHEPYGSGGWGWGWACGRSNAMWTRG